MRNKQASAGNSDGGLLVCYTLMRRCPSSPSFVKDSGPAYNRVSNAIRIMLKQVIPFVEFPSHQKGACRLAEKQDDPYPS